MGASEETFKAMAKTKGKLTIRKLMKEETLLAHETDHLTHLINVLHLDARDRKKLGQKSKIIDGHIEKLKGFRLTLTKILHRAKHWEHSTKKHRHINQLSFRFAHDHAIRELDRPRIDMSKVYAVMTRFQKEKLIIVKDLDLLNKEL